MRRCLLCITLITALLLPAFADSSSDSEDNEVENYMDIQVSLNAGLLNGKIHEYVLSSFCENTDHKESELAWDVKNIPILKFCSDFDILKYGYACFKASVAVPRWSGNMQDYDWLNSVTTAWKNDEATELTNYSIHDNHLEKCLSFTAAVGGNIPLPANIKLTVFAAYQYDFINFTAYDGYTIYKSNNYEQKDIEPSGKVIAYMSESNAALLGLKARINSIPRTTITAGLSLSPKLTFLNAHDYHFRNGDKNSYGSAYWDKFEKIWQLQGELSAQYNFNRHHKAGIYGSIHYIPFSTGLTHSKNLTKSGIPANGAWYQSSPEDYAGGYGKFLWTVNLSYSFSL